MNLNASAENKKDCETHLYKLLTKIISRTKNKLNHALQKNNCMQGIYNRLIKEPWFQAKDVPFLENYFQQGTDGNIKHFMQEITKEDKISYVIDFIKQDLQYVHENQISKEQHMHRLDNNFFNITKLIFQFFFDKDCFKSRTKILLEWRKRYIEKYPDGSFTSLNTNRYRIGGDAMDIQNRTILFNQFKFGILDTILQEKKLKDTFFQFLIDNPDIDREKISGFLKKELKNPTITKGQKISSDNFDLKGEFPLKRKEAAIQDVAERLIFTNTEILKNLLPSEDYDKFITYKNYGDKEKFLIPMIQNARQIAQEHEKEYGICNTINKAIEIIKQYLPECIGADVKFLNIDEDDIRRRIHLFNPYDYFYRDNCLHDTGVFDTSHGDILLNDKYYQDIPINIPEKIKSLGNLNLLATIIHEILHSISIMNYGIGMLNKRLGLRFNEKRKNCLINEATTQTLTESIMNKMMQKECGYEIVNGFCYSGSMSILKTLEKIDNIPKSLFWKAMLVRKRAEGEKVELNTPLFELIATVNGREIKGDKVSYHRPYYYQIIDGFLTLVNLLAEKNQIYLDDKDNGYIQNFNQGFLEKKNINVVKEIIHQINEEYKLKITLETLFDKSLLNSEKTDFNDEILQVYKEKSL